MPLPRYLAPAIALSTIACSQAVEQAPPRDERAAFAPEPRVEEPEQTPLVDRVETPRARPRLSQTVTLGQGEGTPYMPQAEPTQVAGPGPSVVVNNTIVVMPSAPAFYGGYAYGGYGYGGYGHGAREGGVASRAAAPPSWGASGWEGAQRTAAPGHAPAVGGNWAPATSYGPKTLR